MSAPQTMTPLPAIYAAHCPCCGALVRLERDPADGLIWEACCRGCGGWVSLTVEGSRAATAGGG